MSHTEEAENAWITERLQAFPIRYETAMARGLKADVLAVLECDGPSGSRKIHYRLRERNALHPEWDGSDTVNFLRLMVARGDIRKPLAGPYALRDAATAAGRADATNGGAGS